MKSLPKLALVGKNEEQSSPRSLTNEFEIISLEQLTRSERELIQRQVSDILPRSAIAAIARTNLRWDLRPIITRPGDGAPSLVRFGGPDVERVSYISTRLRETFERLKESSELSSLLFEWGMYGNDLWFRRPLVDATLAHILSSNRTLNEQDTFLIAANLVEEVYRWHERGVVHAHITSSNVVVRGDYKISLIDPAIGLALVQASNNLVGYNLQSFAPELLCGQTVVYSSDVYGLGLVLRRLFYMLNKQYALSSERSEKEKALKPYIDLASSMLEHDPRRRPSLSQVRMHMSDVVKKFPQGRIVRVGQKYPTVQDVKEVAAHDGERQYVVERTFSREEVTETQAIQPHAFSGGTHVQTAIYQTMAGQPAPASSAQIQPAYLASNAASQVYSHVAGIIPDSNAPKKDLGKKDNGLIILVALFSLLLVGFYYYRTTGLQSVPVIGQSLAEHFGQPLEYEDLKENWNSNLPSRMLSVALAAVRPGSPRESAESIILQSISGKTEVLPNLVNSSLLKVAFDARWEGELSENDRRTALALALAPLLKEKTPQDLLPLEELHPGVILALTASVNRDAVKGFFSNIPAVVLLKLPRPIGQAFQELLSGQPNLDCSALEIQQLSRISARGGVESAEDVSEFLKEDSARRLRALAILFSDDNSRAEVLLSLLLKHPNLSLQIDSIKWGKDWDLVNWKELDQADRLFVLAGMTPGAKVSDDNIGKLFAHPRGEIRSYAICKALDRIHLAHPGAYEVFKILEKNPDLLNPRQTIELASILENPKKIAVAKIQAWLSSSPPEQIVVPLLLSTHSAEQGTSVDTAFAVYLRGKNWKPDLAVLRKLSIHPDSYTRLFAYSEIYAIDDKETARELLLAALKTEKNNVQLTQLQQMLSSL